MNRLPVSDSEHVDAARQLLEQGEIQEASQRLNLVGDVALRHPSVLKLRCRMFAAARQWGACLGAARALTEAAPDEAESWLTLADVYQSMQRWQEAYEITIANALNFPDSWQLLYDTARYGWILGKKAEAEEYFRMALAIGNAADIKRRATDDKQLEGLAGMVG